MKKSIKFLAAAILGLAAVACSSPEKMAEMAENVTVKCEPAVLEVVAGEIDATVTVTYPDDWGGDKIEPNESNCTYSDNINAGAATCTFKYAEGVEANLDFTIQKATPTEEMFTHIESAVYDGNEKSRRVQQKLGFLYQRKTEGIEVSLLGEIRTGHSNLMTKERWQKVELFRQQKALLDTFLERGAISQAQYNKSFGDLRDLMEMHGVE